jgi:hypothetical protein
VLARAPNAAPVTSRAEVEPSRELGANATFGDLVRTARVLIRNPQATAHGACLLAQNADGYSLRADLAPAIDGLPDAPAELDGQLQRAEGPMRVLTPYGPTAGGDAALVLTSFTAVVPQAARAPALAVALTDAGAYLRYGASQASDADGPLLLDALITRLHAADGDALIYVTAEAAVAIADVVALLRLLPVEREVALAIALPSSTTLPSASAALAPAVDRCPEGQPEIDADAAQGDLDQSAVLSAIAPLRVQAQDCLDAARGPARAGGRVALAVRVAADGSVARACMLSDAIGDPALAECVLSSARALRFAAPKPSGVVDVHLPLSLQPAGPSSQRALCN